MSGVNALGLFPYAVRSASKGALRSTSLVRVRLLAVDVDHPPGLKRHLDKYGARRRGSKVGGSA